MKEEFWRGRKVLVTGHTGFKGAWIAIWLQSLGARVTGFALPPPTTPSLFEICDVARRIAASHLGDIRDPDLLKRVFAAVRPDIVFHMAAQPLVRRSYAAPLETYTTNVIGTVHLLEAARATPGVRAVVNVTTDKCYENTGSARGYRESDPMGGHDPYSSSKGCAELVSAAYRNSYFQDRDAPALATARSGNVVGGGDWADDRLVPDMVRAFAAGKPVLIRNPGAIRPWQHVLEPLEGYLILAERLCEDGRAFGEAWNFGPDEADARPVRWIVERLVSLWGNGANWIQDQGPHPHEAASLKLDCAKAKARLGWRPRWDLATTLERTVEWYKALRDGADMHDLTLGQIAAFSRADCRD